VLDYGCGIGENAIELAERGVVVVAADLNCEAFRFAQWRVKKLGMSDRIKFYDLDEHGDGGLQDMFLDGIVCFDVLEHLHSPEEVREKIALFKNITPNIWVCVTFGQGKGSYPMHIEDPSGELEQWLINEGVKIINRGNEGW